MKSSVTGFTMLLFLISPPVWAEEAAYGPIPFSRAGYFYLGAGMAAGEYMDVADDLGSFFAAPVKAEETIGVDLRAGYRIHRNLASEVQFQWNSGVDAKFEAVDVAILELETWTLTGNLKAYVLTDRIESALLGGRIQPFLMAGVGMMHFDVRDRLGLDASGDGQDLAARFGGGLDFYVTSNIGFYLDVTYLLTTGDLEGLDHIGLSLGAIYRF